jgi:hypothetical protein
VIEDTCIYSLDEVGVVGMVSPAGCN